jgi:hypothetical protein
MIQWHHHKGDAKITKMKLLPLLLLLLTIKSLLLMLVIIN